MKRKMFKKVTMLCMVIILFLLPVSKITAASCPPHDFEWQYYMHVGSRTERTGSHEYLYGVTGGVPEYRICYIITEFTTTVQKKICRKCSVEDGMRQVEYVTRSWHSVSHP